MSNLPTHQLIYSLAGCTKGRKQLISFLLPKLFFAVKRQMGPCKPAFKKASSL